MKIKCEYCGNYINDFDEKCPSCGGINKHLRRQAIGVPTTIEELNLWCTQKNIPLETARFFIGVNYQGPRAFGIYKDETTGNFIVYKNKSDGSRAIRYEGKDEAYAVHELYQKIKDEMLNQRQHQQPQYGSELKRYKQRFRGKLTTTLFFFLAISVFLMITFAAMHGGPSRGYYDYNDSIYYYQPSDGWYIYQAGDWAWTYADSTLSENYDDYYSSSTYYSSYDASDFSDSGYYEESTSSYDSDDDWDSGWDSGDSWDSGYTNWNSNW